MACKDLKETIALMQSDTYHDRFKAEYYQLETRLNKLEAILVKYKQGTLEFEPDSDYKTLYEQFMHMLSYQSILRVRAVQEGIEL